jgi:hypothetical protein
MGVQPTRSLATLDPVVSLVAAPLGMHPLAPLYAQAAATAAATGSERGGAARGVGGPGVLAPPVLPLAPKASSSVFPTDPDARQQAALLMQCF